MSNEYLDDFLQYFVYVFAVFSGGVYYSSLKWKGVFMGIILTLIIIGITTTIIKLIERTK